VVELLALLAIIGTLGIIGFILVRGQTERISRRRLQDYRAAGLEEDAEAPPTPRPALRRYRWIAAVTAVLVGVLLVFVLNWPIGFGIALAIITGLLGWQVEQWWHARRIRRLEEQLADAIDLMVAAVKAGTSLQGALESAASNAPQPLKTQLDEVVGRIRFGDDPVEALSELELRVPLETFRLFSLTLAVNWQVGGRLALTLANVGRTVRDRIELSRRMVAMTTQARLSVISILAVTYFLAALMWRNDPARMQAFLLSGIGQSATVGAMLLQGIGVVWISRLSQMKF
jgi:tight adherence protein B